MLFRGATWYIGSEKNAHNALKDAAVGADSDGDLFGPQSCLIVALMGGVLAALANATGARSPAKCSAGRPRASFTLNRALRSDLRHGRLGESVGKTLGHQVCVADRHELCRPLLDRPVLLQPDSWTLTGANMAYHGTAGGNRAPGCKRTCLEATERRSPGGRAAVIQSSATDCEVACGDRRGVASCPAVEPVFDHPRSGSRRWLSRADCQPDSWKGDFDTDLGIVCR